MLQIKKTSFGLIGNDSGLMDLRCRVDQLIDSNCHLELNSMNAGIVMGVVVQTHF